MTAYSGSAFARARSLLALVASLGLLATPAVAQDDEDSGDTQPSGVSGRVDSLTGPRPTDEVVVTGSRLKRDTYSSISPLQVISGQVSREIGLIDPSTILQESTAASGVQIDLTFQGFVLDNGPGATTIDLRGLGAGRTLLLINGRRISPAGVEGAPVSPDTGLIPGSMVQQYEVLLDGASSVYGSDAVSGVVNVILRKDFDGLELEAFSSIPADDYSAGNVNGLSAAWGYNGDRGFIGVGVEFEDIEPITLDDRDWTRGCQTHVEITESGEIRTLGLDLNFEQNMRPSECIASGLVGRFAELGTGGFGSLYYTPGSSNVGIPNFSENSLYSVPISVGPDGFNTVSWVDYASNGNQQFAQIIPDIQSVSAIAYGEYTLPGEANITPYFEFGYAERETSIIDGGAQFFPLVPGNNPFNPCNPVSNPNGIDCGLAHDAVLADPAYEAAFIDFYTDLCAGFGIPPAGCTPATFGLFVGPLGDTVTIQPVVNVRGDRGQTEVEVSQTRLVAGVRGDMPWLQFGSVENWSFDFYVSHSESDGTSARSGIRDDRINLALGNFSQNGTPCVNDTGEVLAADAAPGCVPVNMFAESLYAPLIGGDFATQAERDYLFDSRDFDTKYTQQVFSLYANGDLFEMPGGTALFGIGAEYRNDEIESIPDAVARDGLFFGFFADGGAVGEKWTKEYFAELELPLLAGRTAFQELTANVSTRHTEDEFYGSAWTYSAKLAWRPVDSLLIRGTAGTTFRAPNLRENFLLGQTGFLNLFDPCVIPDSARNPVTGGYDPLLDDREPEVLANCLANGVDPTSLDNNGITTYSTEVSAGGAVDVREEQSDSMSAGFTWEQPFFTAFDLVLGATYYELDIRDEIIEPSAQFIINDCYFDAEGDSTFCSRIERDPTSNLFDIINRGFINRDSKRARGVDVNMTVDWPTQMFGRAVDLQADFAFNRTLEIRDIFIDDVGTVTEDEDVGEFGFPEWKGRMAFRADVGNWRYTWSTRYISSVEQQIDFVDSFGNIVDGLSDTCGGPTQGDENCRDVGFAENYFVHDASIYYRGDVWTLGGGLRNVFNEAPPLVDGSEVFSFNNVPFGAGYDILGRTLFLNAVYRWQ
ncbi:MAG: TonB-dependent receptor [Woeseiaceae bacterium]|nr:TonB-dependent receptor [Woeseiaceae bacterium]